MKDVLAQIRQLGLLDPTDHEVLKRRMLAPRLANLQAKVGGFLDNGKQNADILLERISAQLTEEHGLGEAVYKAKFIYSRVADPAIIDELAERCDFIITGIGD